MKKCTICGEMKDLSGYYVYANGRIYVHCKKCHNKYQKIWRTNNPEEKVLMDKRNSKKRMRIPRNKINNSLSNAIVYSLFYSHYDTPKKWEKIVGYSRQELKQHLEKQFTPEMNWNNHSIYWQIDHMKPKSSFNFNDTNDKEFLECWSIGNLRPLKVFDNFSKRNKEVLQ